MSVKQISVFEPQEINGEIVEPLCLPASDTSVSHAVAGATNLVWFAFHLSLADRNLQECIRLSEMLKSMLSSDADDEFFAELDDAVKMLENLLDGKDDIDYFGDDESQNT